MDWKQFWNQKDREEFHKILITYFPSESPTFAHSLEQKCWEKAKTAEEYLQMIQENLTDDEPKNLLEDTLTRVLAPVYFEDFAYVKIPMKIQALEKQSNPEKRKEQIQKLFEFKLNLESSLSQLQSNSDISYLDFQGIKAQFIKLQALYEKNTKQNLNFNQPINNNSSSDTLLPKKPSINYQNKQLKNNNSNRSNVNQNESNNINSIQKSSAERVIIELDSDLEDEPPETQPRDNNDKHSEYHDLIPSNSNPNNIETQDKNDKNRDDRNNINPNDDLDSRTAKKIKIELSEEQDTKLDQTKYLERGILTKVTKHYSKDDIVPYLIEALLRVRGRMSLSILGQEVRIPTYFKLSKIIHSYQELFVISGQDVILRNDQNAQKEIERRLNKTLCPNWMREGCESKPCPYHHFGPKAQIIQEEIVWKTSTNLKIKTEEDPYKRIYTHVDLKLKSSEELKSIMNDRNIEIDQNYCEAADLRADILADQQRYLKKREEREKEEQKKKEQDHFEYQRNLEEERKKKIEARRNHEEEERKKNEERERKEQAEKIKRKQREKEMEQEKQRKENESFNEVRKKIKEKRYQKKTSQITPSFLENPFESISPSLLSDDNEDNETNNNNDDDNLNANIRNSNNLNSNNITKKEIQYPVLLNPKPLSNVLTQIPGPSIESKEVVLAKIRKEKLEKKERAKLEKERERYRREQREREIKEKEALQKERLKQMQEEEELILAQKKKQEEIEEQRKKEEEEKKEWERKDQLRKEWIKKEEREKLEEEKLEKEKKEKERFEKEKENQERLEKENNEQVYDFGGEGLGIDDNNDQSDESEEEIETAYYSDQIIKRPTKKLKSQTTTARSIPEPLKQLKEAELLRPKFSPKILQEKRIAERSNIGISEFPKNRSRKEPVVDENEIINPRLILQRKQFREYNPKMGEKDNKEQFLERQKNMLAQNYVRQKQLQSTTNKPSLLNKKNEPQKANNNNNNNNSKISKTKIAETQKTIKANQTKNNQTQKTIKVNQTKNNNEKQTNPEKTQKSNTKKTKNNEKLPKVSKPKTKFESSISTFFKFKNKVEEIVIPPDAIFISDILELLFANGLTPRWGRCRVHWKDEEFRLRDRLDDSRIIIALTGATRSNPILVDPETTLYSD